VLSSGGL